MEDLKILKRYQALIMPYVGIFLVAIVFEIVMTSLGLATPLLTRALFDYAYPYRDLTLLNITIAAIIVTYFLYFFLNTASEYLQIYIGQETIAALTERVFHAIQCLPIRFHQEKKPGDLLIRVTDDVSKTIGMVMNILPSLIIDGGRFLIILAIALFINTRLALLALVSIPLYILEARFYAARLARIEQDSISADSNIYSRVEERLGNIRTIKAFGQELNETLSFVQLLRRRYRVAVKGKFLEVIRVFTNSITLQIWSVFLTWYLGYQVVRGALTIGEIVALLLYVEQLESPIHSFIDLFTSWKTSLVSMKRLDEVLTQPTEESLTAGTKGLSLRSGEVATDHISFAYAADNEILHDIDVKFHPKSVTAIVGTSGSGKTTLVNLLLRFFDPSDGMILVDGQDISEVRIHELRGKVGIVAQEASLFDGTVMDNILYGNEGMERGDAMRTARLSGAHDFIDRLPGGYDSPVGKGGELLSAGQRQRIAIARVLLRDPKVIILDEATSALDAESEFRIQGVIASLKKTRTVIVIAHRLSTIKTADRILVLDNGRFVEEGLFEELIEKKGAFYRFYWRQFGGLATFRQQLELELERSVRYGSKFCLAILKVKNIDHIVSSEGIQVADKFIDGIDFVLKKNMRMGDNSAVLDHGLILVLLPEIDAGHLMKFFDRMLSLIPHAPREELGRDITPDDLLFLGTRITKKLFRTPEDLLHALKCKVDEMALKAGAIVIKEEDLVT